MPEICSEISDIFYVVLFGQIIPVYLQALRA